MEKANQLFEALLMSVMVIGAAAIDMILLVIIMMTAVAGIAFVRWVFMTIWKSAKAGFRRYRNG